MLGTEATDSQMWSTSSMPGAVPSCFSETFLLNAQDNSGRKRQLAHTTEGMTESRLQTHRTGGKNPSLSGSRGISQAKVAGAVVPPSPGLAQSHFQVVAEQTSE